MSHTPFILAAYGITAVLLAWCALAPVLKARELARQISARQQRT